METKNFNFKPISHFAQTQAWNVTRSWQMFPENYMSPLAIKTTSTTIKWVSKVDFVFGNKEYYFSTHNPTLFKLGPGMWPKVEKMRLENYTSPLAIKTTSTTLKWIPKLISYLELENFTFQPIIPLRSNLGLECDPKLIKCGKRRTHLCSQIKTASPLANQDHVYNSQMGIKSWFHILKWRILLFNP